MRFLLLILYIMGAMTVNAQPAKGRYVLKTREDVPQQHSAFDRNEYGGSLPEVMDLGRKYYSATLDVLDDGMVYFSTSNFFDTGNTCSRTTGDYLVRLERVSGNSYKAAGKFIELALDVTGNGEIELMVLSCVKNIHIRGIVNRYENIAVNAPEKYYLAESGAVEKGPLSGNSITRLEGLVDSLGVNCLGYKVFEDKIVWEDVTAWEAKREVRQLEEPDMDSFRVFTSPHGGFYLILEGSHKVFPSGYTDYAADSRRVYYQGKAMEGACPESFEVIDPLHARAGDVVYYGDVPLHGAHAETFRSLNGGYAMDKDGYYRNGKATKMNRDKKKLLEKR